MRKCYTIEETITQATTTTYTIEAESKEEALANFRSHGSYRGDTAGGKDGVRITQVVELPEDEQ